ncbi:MAG: hypothetical protein M3Z46_02445 [Actinomycetota bacterium]|nr:hypothetical protein [Actinomycetota bacterium]
MVGRSVGSAGAAMWARRDLRRRWLSLVVLGLLAGLSASLAMAAIAGARRADTAFDRLSTRTRAADAVVFPSQTSPGVFDWSKIRGLPYVKDVAPWSLVFGVHGTGSSAHPDLLFMPVDRQWLTTVDRPVVRAGRFWNPGAVGEVMVDESAASQLKLKVGDRFLFHTYETGQFGEGTPKGAVFQARVVGVIRETSQFLFTGGQVFLSPGTLEHYGKAIERIENAHVRLRDPAHDVPAMRRDADRLLAKGTPILDLHSVQRRVGTAISLERVAQVLLGLAVAVAGLVFVGQALARSVAQLDDDAEVLRAIGLTRRERSIAAAAPHLLSLGVALPVALIGAWILSDRFPIGYARTVDPTVGFHIDWVVVGPALALLALAMAVGSLVVAWIHSGRLDRSKPVRPNRLTAALRHNVPLSVGLGTTMAFESGRGRRKVPVGPALFGAVAGVLGIVGTFTIDHGLSDALAHPARAGVTWDATVAAGGKDYAKSVDTLTPTFVKDITSRPEVGAAAILGRIPLPVNGVGIAVFDVKRVRGDLSLVTVKGVPPARADEVALGPATAQQLGVRIGDKVTIRGHETVRLRVVGLALFPHEVHSGFTEGAWVTPRRMRTIGPMTDFAHQTGMEQIAAVRWKPGADHGRSLAAMQKSFGSTDREVSAAELPPELLNLKRVRTVPLVLVTFLVLLAISALGHVLVTSVRRRRHDFAVLRSIGFTRRMTATVVGSHSTSVGLVGLLLGVPFGLAIGRLAWGWVTDEVPLVYVSPVALAALLVTIPATLLVANLIAALPGHRAARLTAAEVLRTE